MSNSRIILDRNCWDLNNVIDSLLRACKNLERYQQYFSTKIAPQHHQLPRKYRRIIYFDPLDLNGATCAESNSFNFVLFVDLRGWKNTRCVSNELIGKILSATCWAIGTVTSMLVTDVGDEICWCQKKRCLKLVADLVILVTNIKIPSPISTNCHQLWIKKSRCHHYQCDLCTSKITIPTKIVFLTWKW